MRPLAAVPLVDAGLLLDGEVPANAVFFDTDALASQAVLVASQSGAQPVISSLVYAERARRERTPKGLAILDTTLLARGVRVVRFDAESARAVFDLGGRLDFRRPPLLRPGEDASSCYRRLRLDVFIFGAALRHRRLIVTNNWSEWQHFPFPDFRRSVADFLERPAPPVP